MANRSAKLFLVNVEDPLSKKSYTISVSADEAKRLETDNYFANLKLEEAKNLEYAKLISEEDVETVEVLDPEINFNESVDGFNDSATGDSAFKWPHDAILLLIEEYRKHQPYFCNGKISQKKLWQKISAQLQAHNYSVIGPQCQSKFAGMKRTYRNIKYHNSKSGNTPKSWPYFTMVDDLLGDKPFVVPVVTCSSTGKRVRTTSECSSDSSSPEQYPVRSKKPKLEPSNNILEALEIRAKSNEEKEDAEAVEALDPEINFNESMDGLNDSATGDPVFKWPNDAILLLIEEYRKHQPNFTDGKISQKKLWERISGQLQAHGYGVSGSQCQSKFAGMKRTYRNIREHNNKFGNSAKTWPYFLLIDDLLGDQPFVAPVVTYASTRKRVKSNSEYSSDSSGTEQDVPTKKPKLVPVDKMLEVLEKRAKKNDENKERRFNQLLAFKEQKAREDLELKTRALDLLEKILSSENKL